MANVCCLGDQTKLHKTGWDKETNPWIMAPYLTSS